MNIYNLTALVWLILSLIALFTDAESIIFYGALIITSIWIVGGELSKEIKELKNEHD